MPKTEESAVFRSGDRFGQQIRPDVQLNRLGPVQFDRRLHTQSSVIVPLLNVFVILQYITQRIVLNLALSSYLQFLLRYAYINNLEAILP